MAAGEEVSLLAVVLIFRPLPQRPLSTWRDFPAPSVGAVMREVGLCVVRLLYHPTGAREGGDR